MKIEFQKINIENFLSIGNAELSLIDRGYTLINGINNNPLDNAKNNGSGKSSIFEAISWALTGQTIRGINNNISNIYSAGGCKVELYFSVDSDNYHIIRTRDHKELGSTLKLFINGQDESGKGLRDTEKILDDYLPDLTSDLIGSVIILGQGLPQRFTNNTPSGRKEVLEKLSKSDFMIEDIKNKLCDRQLVLEQNLRRIEDTQLTLSTKISTLNEQLDKAKVYLESLLATDVLDSTIASYQLEIQKLSKAIDADEKLKIDFIKELQEIESKKNLILLENSKELSSAEIDKNNQSYEIINQKNIVNYSIEQLTQEINKLKNITDVCPTCGQKIPGVYKQDTNSLELKREEYKSIVDECTNRLAEITEAWKIKVAEIEDKYFKLNAENIEKAEQLKFKISDLEQALQSNTVSLHQNEQALAAYEQQRDSLQETKNKTLASIDEYNKEIADLQEEILYNNKEREEIDSRLSIVNKMYTIAKRDFRGYLLTNVIAFIDSKAKEYCEIVFGTKEINFQLDKNNINISYCGKMYENLSGGEKQKLDVIIQFAIRDMLCQFSSFSSNIIILDEIFDNIDAAGCEKIIDLISTTLTDIDSIFIITHHSDIPIGADSVITVIKNEQGISSLK